MRASRSLLPRPRPRAGRPPRLAALAAGTVLILAGCTSVASRSAPPGSASVPSSDARETWDLVWFSDSSVAIAQEWADRIRASRNVEVRVHDFWGPGAGGSASFIVDLIEVQEVEDALKEAEVIGLYTNPGRTAAGDRLYEQCVALGAPPDDYGVADFDEYATLLRTIYDRIFLLRGGRPVIIRAIGPYVGNVRQLDEAGIGTRCRAGWEALTTVARQVAAEYGVPMASMYDAFNGPQHTEDPAAKGLIGPDGVHPGTAGRALQVTVLDSLGYEAVTG